jgi:glutamate N-acetyltransferase/amino-acid N-acetyltransferase
MAVGLSDNPKLLPVRGVKLAACSAAIYKKQRPDLALIACNRGSTAAAVFTRNAFCAAPVLIAREHLAKTQPLYLLINAGNANAGLGSMGIADARLSCRNLAVLAGCPEEAVLPFSTGVIGEQLPVGKICNMLPQLLRDLSYDKWLDVARAIMTTDTVAKGVSRRVSIGDQEITITGIVKGSGMIRPDMATMLAFIATDAAVEPVLLNEILGEAVEESFNRISVDGDTSTNDACVLIATGKAGTENISNMRGSAVAAFRKGVKEVCVYLAQAIVRDGEGATKFVTLDISGGHNQDECKNVAYAIAHSPLVKTALYASDPNWGRILAAIGRAGLKGLEVNNIRILIDDVLLFENGGRSPDYSETAGREIFAKPEIKLHIDLGRGHAKYVYWTCDLSNEYVRINAEYRS